MINIFSRLIGGPSPFDALAKHLEKAMECVDLVIPVLTSALDGDQEKTREIAERIFVLEREADEIKLELRDSLPRTKMLPVARADLLAYLKEQDNLADKAEDLAMMLTVRPLVLPTCCNDFDYRETLLEMAREAVAASHCVAKMFERIKEIKRAAFAGKIADELREEAVLVGQHEHNTDVRQFRLLQCILSIDDPNWRFAASYCLMEVVRSIGKLANHAESMSDFLRLMTAE